MMKRDHGGYITEPGQNVCNPEKTAGILDFSVNLNPLGFPETLRPLVSRHLEGVLQYPDPEYRQLRRAVADKLGVPFEFIWPGNGASELIFQLPRLADFEKCIIPVPCYTDYLYAARSIRLPVKILPLSREASFCLEIKQLESVLTASPQLLFIGQPSNPVGTMVNNNELSELAGNYPRTLFCIDESFADFMPDYTSLGKNPAANIIVIRSLTKIYAIPGLRLGYVVASPEIIEGLRRLLPSWSVNSLAAAIGPELLNEEEYLRKTRANITTEREKLSARLDAFSALAPYPSRANYLTVEILEKNHDADWLAEQLREKGIIIRSLKRVPGLGKNFFRVAVRSAQENAVLGQALEEIFGPPAGNTPRRKPAAGKKRPLMILGTCSNAGKSIIAAAFCRILKRAGLRVAPFKAQNMSLNSFVTAEGGEMGRAQVLQAQACGLAPDVRMNPVLLKPNSCTGSQVIVLGQPLGNLSAKEYYLKKADLWKEVRQAYDSLAREYDLLVLEGAGSPAEINLKANDIVNLKMAAYSGAASLLVGDIDRGGVYASFLGTMELFTEPERELIAGYLVNKFRGDASLLEPAHAYLRKYTNKPVLGVIPMLSGLNLPEEDSVSFKAGLYSRECAGKEDGAGIVVVLADFPHISNFTDFDPLKREKDVSLRIIRSAAELPVHWDLFILPGSKNVIHDLRFLKTSGLAAYLAEAPENLPGEVIGICGGFQMLGNIVYDPDGLESELKSEPGLALLGMQTTIMQEKVLRQTEAVYLPNGFVVSGYEIHHGETTGEGLQVVIKDTAERIIGYSSESGKIWGTYLHGLFDNEHWLNWLLARYRANTPGAAARIDSAVYDLDKEIDKLADVVRDSVDLKTIYRILGL